MSNESNAVQVLPPTALHFEGGGSPSERSMMETAVSRQAQEVQAAMVIAKKYPRDQLGAYNRIMGACKRPGLAEAAQYSFPRGGTNVSGPSIRLAEVLAQNWGNLDFGIVELEQKEGASIVMSYCWDLETNTRQAKVFTVKHERRVGKGQSEQIKLLTDPRDIYEMIANNGARRLRACILGIIPGDIVDDALGQCDETLRLRDSAEGPLIDRARKLSKAYMERFQVTAPLLEMRVGRKAEAWTESDYATLRKIFVTLKDGMGKKEDYFTFEPTTGTKEPVFKPSTGEPATADEKPKAPRKPREPKPSEQAEPPPQEEHHAEPPQEEQQQEPVRMADPLEEVKRLIATVPGLEAGHLVSWMVRNRMAEPAQNMLAKLSVTQLNTLIERWVFVVEDLGGQA